MLVLSFPLVRMCPFGRMAAAQVLLAPPPFCRRETVNLAGLPPLAQADDRHLHQTALISPVIVGVLLDAVDQDHAVGEICAAIHKQPVFQSDGRHFDRLHRGMDGAADLPLGDAVYACEVGDPAAPDGERVLVAGPQSPSRCRKLFTNESLNLEDRIAVEGLADFDEFDGNHIKHILREAQVVGKLFNTGRY